MLHHRFLSRRSHLFAGLVLSSYSTTTNTVTAMSTTPKTALVFLHGLGDTPAGWSSLEDQLPSLRPELKNTRYEFPAAPTIPITINGGGRLVLLFCSASLDWVWVGSI